MERHDRPMRVTKSLANIGTAAKPKVAAKPSVPVKELSEAKYDQGERNRIAMARKGGK